MGLIHLLAATFYAAGTAYYVVALWLLVRDRRTKQLMSRKSLESQPLQGLPPPLVYHRPSSNP